MAERGEALKRKSEGRFGKKYIMHTYEIPNKRKKGIVSHCYLIIEL